MTTLSDSAHSEPCIFKALADESRRHLLDKLRLSDGLTLGELCSELKMSRQAVTKHLKLLEQANLVIPHQKGRFKHHYLNPVPLVQIVDRWTSKFHEQEARSLLDLKNILENNNEST
jgi:DNA-binding transcriptional ArsR family regulator